MDHRPTLKQSNKGFKSKHSSKRSSNLSAHKNHGRVERKTQSVRLKGKETRQDRRNKARQLQKNKKQAARARVGGAPKIVAMVALSEGVDIRSAKSAFLAASEAGDNVPADYSAPVTVRYPEVKQRFTFVEATRDAVCVLDAVKVADIVMFVLDAADHPDDVGEQLLSLIKAQGVPSVFAVAQNLDAIEKKHQASRLKELSKFIQNNFATETKVMRIDMPEKMSQVVRTLSNIKMKQIHWLANRPYMLVDNYDFDLTSEDAGTLRVGGYLRGAPLSANQLIHLPGIGTFELGEIHKSPDPRPLKGDQEEGELCSLERANPVVRHDMVQFNTGIEEEMAEEQKWVEEIDDGFKKPMPRAPGGTGKDAAAHYQAAWIPAEWSDDDERPEDPQGADTPMDGPNSGMIIPGEHADSDTSSIASSGADSDDMLNEMQYDQKYSEAPKDQDDITLEQLEQDDITWPDEMDTPTTPDARVNFKHYRGLKSFMHTPWDPKLMLPEEYAKIFRFESFPRTARKVQEEAQYVGVNPEEYYAVDIIGVPVVVGEMLSAEKPLTMYGMFQHEQKFSMLHFSLQRHSSFKEPLKTGSRMIVHCGPRRFYASPVYSDDNKKSTKNRMHNFFHDNTVVIGSMYGPVIFGAAPVLLFREDPQGGPPKFVAGGAMHSVDPDRLIIRRVVLAGDCVKTRKKKATVRRMFWTAEDVRWFKKIELFTKYGRHGHIRKPIGTHGHMKCIFDGVVMSQDTICMALYKRVYPPWDTTLISFSNPLW